MVVSLVKPSAPPWRLSNILKVNILVGMERSDEAL